MAMLFSQSYGYCIIASNYVRKLYWFISLTIISSYDESDRTKQFHINSLDNLVCFQVTYCKEFLLPPTELYHTAKLVRLVGSPGLDYRQYGVLAISPEGLVCYWPSMTYESSPIETDAELVGQEFHSLIEFQVLQAHKLQLVYDIWKLNSRNFPWT